MYGYVVDPYTVIWVLFLKQRSSCVIAYLKPLRSTFPASAVYNCPTQVLHRLSVCVSTPAGTAPPCVLRAVGVGALCAHASPLDPSWVASSTRSFLDRSPTSPLSPTPLVWQNLTRSSRTGVSIAYKILAKFSSKNALFRAHLDWAHTFKSSDPQM